MMNGLMYLFLAIMIFSPLIIDSAYAQVDINVTETTPCFLNYTAGIDLWRNCGADEDYLQFALIGFEWVTGGFFSMVIVIILVIMTYIKYHNPIYPLAIGVMYLPTAWYLFPEQWLGTIIVFAGIAIFSLIYGAILYRTKDR